ncbi:MAG: bacteriohemerythrin [Negativicutes bacterium]|nr:bacteriohemerythrin [Negativicutes bacterium]
MALIDWSSQFSVAVPDIDEEHKRLVGMLNSLHEAMKVGKGKQRLLELFEELYQYSKYHFAHEERLMKKCGFAGYAEHKKEHDAFVLRASELREQVTKHNAQLTTQTLTFLRDWVVNHIGAMDKKYSAVLASSG